MTVTSASLRAARTRNALLLAGLELFAERPVDAVAIDEVVARAGVAKGSFFNHFADKAGFAAAVAEAVRMEIETRVAMINNEVFDPVERLANGLRTGARYALDEPRRTAALARSAADTTPTAHPLNRGLLADLEACAAVGRVCARTIDTAALFWLGCCRTLMAELAERPPPLDLAEERIEQMLRFALRGVLEPAASTPTD